MKNSLKLTLVTLLTISSVVACSRGDIAVPDTEQQSEIPQYSEVEALSAGKEYNAFGVSKKRFSLFFKSKISDSTLIKKNGREI